LFKNIKKTFFSLFIILTFYPLFAQIVNIKFIETSDVHGALLPYDLTNDAQTTSSLARVYSYVISQRKQSNYEIVLLDNGDLIQGDPITYFYNFVDTTGVNIFADALNFMKYDAATIGNHDIETGHSVYDKFRKDLKLPWLAANAINTETKKPYFEPYAVINKGGVKIAVFGLITPGVPSWLPEFLWRGIQFEDMIESAKKWIPIIREKEKPDLLIGLFHSGVNSSYDDQDENTYKNENASQLVAERVPGFDVVFVGHDHAGWNFKTANEDGDSVLIIGPTSRARNIAVANIQMELDSVTGKWIRNKVAGEIVETKNYSPDDNFINRYENKLYDVKKYVERPLGTITKSVSSRESIFGPSEYVDLVHKIQLDITGAEVSFTSPLGYNSTIKEGTICIKDIFKIYHYENFLYTMSLSGQEIKDYLEFSYGNWFNKMQDEHDHLILFAEDDSGNLKLSARSGIPETKERFYNYSSASGIDYTVDVSKPAGERVKITTLQDGRTFNLDETYTVAINSYRGSGGGGHLTRGSGISPEELPKRILSYTNKDFRFYVANWMEENKVVTPRIISKWKVVPESWWEKGRDKDYKLLFGEDAPHPEKTMEELNK
jgi:2',3'-cyclic-nucleotide 2'-phosphodiesterase/3'-nucleotidase